MEYKTDNLQIKNIEDLNQLLSNLDIQYIQSANVEVIDSGEMYYRNWPKVESNKICTPAKYRVVIDCVGK